MNIRRFIKTHCPKPILLPLQTAHRVVHWMKDKALKHIVQTRARKFMPYYQDELSREILSGRLKYFSAGDINIFLDMAEKAGIKFHDFYNLITERYSGIVLLYDNEGSYFRYTKRLLSSSDWADKYRLMTLKQFLEGSEILPTEMMVLVLTKKGRKSFQQAAAVRNFNAYVNFLFAIREDLEYFDVFSPLDDEVVIDAGSFNGATAIQFLEWGKGKVKHVYSFEFDPLNAAKCEKNLKPYADKVTFIPKGTWDKDEVMYIDVAGTEASNLHIIGNTAVYLTSIDNVVKDERVTFIKMDIEGAELKSLMGARNTIIKNHPRLAICVYHKTSDLYEIPGYILSIVPEYKFLLRHYSSCNTDTILYAYCD